MTDLTQIQDLLHSVISNAQPLMTRALPVSISKPNRVYVGKHHKLPPDATPHVSASGKTYWLPSEDADNDRDQEQDQDDQESQDHPPVSARLRKARNQELAYQYSLAISALQKAYDEIAG